MPQGKRDFYSGDPQGQQHYLLCFYIVKQINAPLAGSTAACDGLSFYAKITSLNFALSAEVHFLRNSKVVLQEWNNAAVRQAFPFCGATQQALDRRH